MLYASNYGAMWSGRKTLRKRSENQREINGREVIVKMPFQPVEDTAQVRVQAAYFGIPVENVYHVHKPSPWTESDCEELAIVVMEWAQEEYLIRVVNSYVIDTVDVRDLTIEDGAYHSLACEVGCAGTITATPGLPGSVSALVSWTTGHAGRNARGRSYWVGLDESAVTGNSLTSGAQSNFQGVADDLMARINAHDDAWFLCQVSRILDGVPRSSGRVFDIVAANVKALVATQRRRLT
jgi:hypothetical protein